jgi:hypothetical protein
MHAEKLQTGHTKLQATFFNKIRTKNIEVDSCDKEYTQQIYMHEVRQPRKYSRVHCSRLEET